MKINKDNTNDNIQITTSILSKNIFPTAFNNNIKTVFNVFKNKPINENFDVNLLLGPGDHNIIPSINPRTLTIVDVMNEDDIQYFIVAQGTNPLSNAIDFAVDSNGNIYIVGGSGTSGFLNINGVLYNGIAKWDSTTRTFSNVGTGTNGNIRTILIDNSDNVYIGGDFTIAGSVNTPQKVAKWDVSTSTFISIDSIIGVPYSPLQNVFKLAFDNNGILYASGSIPNQIRYYDSVSSVWEPLPITSGTVLGPTILTMVFTSTNILYVAGNAFPRLKRWIPNDSSSPSMGGVWQDIPPSSPVANSTITSLDVDDNDNIYLAGFFTSAGGIPANAIAVYNPSNNEWSTFGDGVSAVVRQVKVIDSSIYISGQFTNTGGQPLNLFARWDGTTWINLGKNIDSTNVHRFLFVNDRLYLLALTSGNNLTLYEEVQNKVIGTFIEDNNIYTSLVFNRLSLSGNNVILQRTTSSSPYYILSSSSTVLKTI
jgi:hypothetical protein